MERGYATGWGLTSTNGSTSRTLQGTTLTITNNCEVGLLFHLLKYALLGVVAQGSAVEIAAGQW